MYKCCACGKQFQSGERLSDKALWDEFLHEKRTYAELARMHRCSVSTIQRRIGGLDVEFHPKCPKHAVVVLDTTYFGRGFGVMVFQDALSGMILDRRYVRNETNAEYLAGLEHLRQRGTEILAVVCDGHKGLIQAIDYCPVQMCQFHMQQIVCRSLTKNPHLIAGRELLSLTKQMKSLGCAAFTGRFSDWCCRWDKFLNERTLLSSGKTTYTHRRLRKARQSIRSHLPWLFTYEDYPGLGIPNTTNLLEGTNSEMKRLLRNHNGLSGERRVKFIDGFLETWGSNPNKEEG